jgi:ABC-type glycerol-3-phosphate transport system substrate-binding protein
MRRTPLRAMLTVVAVLAAAAAIAGCGNKSTGKATSPGTTGTTHKQPSRAPAY